MLLKRKSVFHDAEEEEIGVNINITPMIDVLTCLLFFLLLSFGAVIIALINTTVPALSEGDDAPESNKAVVTMTLSISAKGFACSGSGENIPEAEMKTLAKSLPLADGTYDYQGLNDFLFDVKNRYKDSDSIVIVPESDIPYEVLIKSLDASREREAEREGKPWRIPLFPAAVISTLVK
jgi:biopolymer transport protein ExbD